MIVDFKSNNEISSTVTDTLSFPVLGLRGGSLGERGVGREGGRERGREREGEREGGRGRKGGKKGGRDGGRERGRDGCVGREGWREEEH